jgi:hypothetical protein
MSIFGWGFFCWGFSGSRRNESFAGIDLDFAGAILPTSDQSVAHEPMPF